MRNPDSTKNIATPSVPAVPYHGAKTWQATTSSTATPRSPSSAGRCPSRHAPPESMRSRMHPTAARRVRNDQNPREEAA